MEDRKHSNIPEWKKSKVDVREASLEMKLQQALGDEINSKRNIFLEMVEIIDDIERIMDNNGNINEGLKYLDVIKRKALKLLEKQGITQMVFEDNKAKFGWCEIS